MFQLLLSYRKVNAKGVVNMKSVKKNQNAIVTNRLMELGDC